MHPGPLLAQARDQQLEYRRSMFGPVDAAGAQVSAQQLLATEHVQLSLVLPADS